MSSKVEFGILLSPPPLVKCIWCHTEQVIGAWVGFQRGPVTVPSTSVRASQFSFEIWNFALSTFVHFFQNLNIHMYLSY